MNQNILDKLKKILRLATGNTNPHEAEVALQKAQQIAIENQIDIAGINFQDENAKENYEKGAVETGQRFSVCQRYVNWIIGNHFNVKVILSGSRLSGRRIYFIGKTSDIDFCKWINEYLNETFMKSWHNHKKIYDSPTRLRESFLYGVFKGLDAKLTQNKLDIESNKFNNIASEQGEDKSREIQQSYALVTTNAKEELEKAVGEFFPKLKTGAKHRINLQSEVTMQAGFAKGQTINVNRPIAGFSRATQLV